MVDEQADAQDVASKQKQVEKRKHVRFRISLPVCIRLSNGDIARAHAVDISLGGIYIEYGAPADAGKVFEMLFDLPFDKDFKRVIVKAEVVRSIVIGGKDVFGIAFMFKEFGKDTEKVLEKYLELRELKRAN